MASFYCYLNYDYVTDFVIDLDNVWQWLGFGQKVNAKRVLEKNFILNKDYKLLVCQMAKQSNGIKGGHNKFKSKTEMDFFINYMMNVMKISKHNL